MPTRSKRLATLLQPLNPTALEIIDDSSKHATHNAMAGRGAEETHFHIVITSAEFKDKTRIDCHRLVQEAVKEEFETGLHALQITAKQPA